ncbi:VOC family protein [Niabella beijingensis]|uniref:VOC family protein n=1 Tax=Niabella beijingensis TaxID=2872700 RepID=UPI001CBDEECB|nr:VOC family protein [Niabella beijingensis]MBZ4190182.1 VOC family protein [Niabella beijingensis]
MKEEMSINRIVPNIYSDDLEKSKDFYRGFLHMDIIMDHGWVLTFASKKNPLAQVNVLENQKKEVLNNERIFLSVEVSDVNGMYRKAKELGLEITYPIANEPWGVRRFFVKDPNGATINLLSHNS